MSYIFQNETPTSRKLTRDDNEQLRGSFDGSESVMARGFGVVAPRELHQTTRCDENDPHDPYWFNNKSAVRRFLLNRFPKMATDRSQQHSAAKWLEVINRYFRMGEAGSRIEEDLLDEFGWTISAECVVQQIRRCRQGLRPNGKSYSTRKRGRPRKQPENERIEKMGLVPGPLPSEQLWPDANP